MAVVVGGSGGAGRSSKYAMRPAIPTRTGRTPRTVEPGPRDRVRSDFHFQGEQHRVEANQSNRRDQHLGDWVPVANVSFGPERKGQHPEGETRETSEERDI